jgi:hypothetical protein
MQRLLFESSAFFTFLYLILVLMGCSQTKSTEKFVMTDRFEVLDENASNAQTWCETDVKDFLEMSYNDCSFKIEEIEYDIRRRIIIENDGELKEYWYYGSEGPITYSRKELTNDPIFFESTGLKKFKLSQLDGKRITSSIDTLEIDQIHRQYKLIVCKQSDALRRKNLKIIYKYL